MSLISAIRRLATKFDDLLDSKASLAANDAQFDAKQRNEFDITKSNDAGASDGLGNVVRVPTKGGNGVSQAPAIATPGTGGEIASEQPSAALQGGVASPAKMVANAVSFETASSPSTTVDGDARMHLMAAVKAARSRLTQRNQMLASTKENYDRKQKILEEQWLQLQAQAHSTKLSTVQTIGVLLGKYATKPRSFYAMRRALHFGIEEQLLDALKAQDKLQKSWAKSQLEEHQHSLLLDMATAAAQLDLLTKTVDHIQGLSLEACLSAYWSQFYGPLPKREANPSSSAKSLVKVLNRRMPNWQDAFRAANSQSQSPYRAHALVQSLLGIRPAEFDPAPNPLVDAQVPQSNRPGVVVTLLATGNVKVQVQGAKLGLHSGQEIRSMEIAAHAVPQWFADQLQQAGGSMHLRAKTQALRDHYERLSAKVFTGQTFGKNKVPLHVTPYCFRHAVTTQLRESGWAAEEIAAFLGQQSDDTPKHYGLAKGGKRKAPSQATAVVRDSVQASQPVKSKKSNWADAEFGSKPQSHQPPNRK
ncbi:MAG: site-specific integrase [Comamonas sp.]|nr:site-specific integrase [Comamonas sp.]